MNTITQPDDVAIQSTWESHYLWQVIEFNDEIGRSMRRGLWPASIFGGAGEKILARKFHLWEAENEAVAQRAKDSTPAQPVPVRIVDPSGLDGEPVPPRKWFVPGLIPSRNVTLLTGDGGLGKSLCALQLSIASVLGNSVGSVGRVTPYSS